MIITESGFYIPRSDIAYIKGGYAYLWCGAKIKLKVFVDTKMK